MRISVNKDQRKNFYYYSFGNLKAYRLVRANLAHLRHRAIDLRRGCQVIDWDLWKVFLRREAEKVNFPFKGMT